MGRNTNRDQTPDLFSTAAGPSSDEASTATTGRPSRRSALPKNLPKAIRYLADEELDWLLRVTIQEAKRRGRPMPMTVAPPTSAPGASSLPIPKQAGPPGRPTHKEKIGVAAVALTRGQINAVRAAFKAGVTPSRIARQFGLSLPQVRKALAADEPER
jgi:hypothetical protein